MSGGSFNYLFDAVISDRSADLLSMARQLRDLGFHDIARETESFVAEPPKELRMVWHAVEWWRSNDWSKGQAVEIAAAYDKLLAVKSCCDRDGWQCRCGRFISGMEMVNAQQ